MAKKEESFLLLSLNDSKAKKIAQVVNNETCKKILTYLAKNEHATETKISDDLKIPLPTAHYNLSLLVESRLVDINEFHYSQKGKEVNHYALANKYIIIAPKDEPNFLEKLKNILPAFGIIAATSITIKFIQYVQTKPQENLIMAKEAAPSLMAARVADSSAQVVQSSPDIALWFFVGAVSSLFIYTVVDWIKKK